MKFRSRDANVVPSEPLLVVGYGNTLRRDDGVGPKIAEAVDALQLPGVRTLVCHQLTPELAEPIARSPRVVFVDAAIGSTREVALCPIEAAETGRILAHATDPRSLLALAKQLFIRVPQAWLLTVPVEDIGMGEYLSPRAEAGLAAALLQIQRLAAQLA